MHTHLKFNLALQFVTIDIKLLTAMQGCFKPQLLLQPYKLI